jgi:hypothetical protein
LREEAFRLTLEAEAMYADQFPQVKVGLSETGYSVSANEIFAGRRRLDAYYYNPHAEAALFSVQSGDRLMSLSAVTADIFGVPRFKHVYSTKGIPYLDSEDLFKTNPELTKYIPEATKKDATKYFVESGWVLMASSGQLYGLNGSAIIANDAHEGKIISNHVVRIVPRDIRAGYLAMALAHPLLGRPLISRLAFGSEVPEIAPDDLRHHSIPRLGSIFEDQIAGSVEKASQLRTEADRAEDDAVLLLEAFLDRRLAGQGESDALRGARETEAYIRRPVTDEERRWAEAAADALASGYSES